MESIRPFTAFLLVALLLVATASAASKRAEKAKAAREFRNLQVQNKLFQGLSENTLKSAFWKNLYPSTREYFQQTGLTAEEHQRRLQGLPVCFDDFEGCSAFAIPQTLGTFRDDEAFADQGYCSIFSDVLETQCSLSCGRCEKVHGIPNECVNLHDELPSSLLTCDQLLATTPDACECPSDGQVCTEEDGTSFDRGGLSVLYMRNWCRKSCHDLLGANGENVNDFTMKRVAPCFDVCEAGHPACDLPFEWKKKPTSKAVVFESPAPIWGEESAYEWWWYTQWIDGYSPQEHDTILQEMNLRWCPLLPELGGSNPYIEKKKPYFYGFITCPDATGTPSSAPTLPITDEPTKFPTSTPTNSPLSGPTLEPTTSAPTASNAPTTVSPTRATTVAPTLAPSASPTKLICDPTLKNRLRECKNTGESECTVNLPDGGKQGINFCETSTISNMHVIVDGLGNAGRRELMSLEDMPLVSCRSAVDPSVPLFNMNTNAQVTLTNMRIKGCERIVTMRSDTIVNINNVIIEDSPATILEGIATTDVVINMDNSIVRGARAEEGSFIFCSACKNLNINLSNSKFNNNAVTTHGGIISIVNFGPMIFEGGSLNIVGCDFNDNFAGQFASIFLVNYGIFRFDVTITDSSFVNNRAVSLMGMFAFFGPDEIEVNDELVQKFPNREFSSFLPEFGCFMLIKNCVISGAAVTDDWGVGVMAIRQAGVQQVTIENTLISESQSIIDGGAIELISFFQESTKELVSQFPVSLISKNCSYIGNTAANAGGVFIFSSDAKARIEDSLFQENVAPTGGVMMSTNIATAEIEFVDCKFIRNKATIKGGVAHAIGNVNYQFDGCTFDGNHAVEGGGVISLFSPNVGRVDPSKKPKVTFNNNCLVSNSYSEQAGGVINAQGKSLVEISDCTFEKNYVRPGSDGGAIYALGLVEIVITDSLLTANRAGRNGGFAYLKVLDIQETPSLIMTTSQFIENNAPNQGGVIATNFESTINVVDCTFLNNFIDSSLVGGGGVIAFLAADVLNPQGNAIKPGPDYIQGDLDTTFSGTTFHNNSALVGGVIFFDYPFFLDTTFQGQQAGENSQSFVISSTPSEERRRVLSNEDSHVISRSLSSDTSYVMVDNCKFIANKAVSNPELSSAPSHFELRYPYDLLTVQPCVENPAKGMLLTEMLPFQIRSGNYLPTICGYLFDGFNQSVIAAEDNVLSLEIIKLNEDELFEIPLSPLETFYLSSVVSFEDLIAYSEISGPFHLQAVPRPELTPSGSRYSSNNYMSMIEWEMVPCLIDSEVLRVNDESIFAECYPTNRLCVGGNWLDNDLTAVYPKFEYPKEVEGCTLCPAGTQRPETLPAHICDNCLPGYVSTPNRTFCQFCEVFYELSWNTTNDRCDVCPKGAICLGGDKVVPALGFFHSSTLSYQFHECINFEACDYFNRTTNLTGVRDATDPNDVNQEDFYVNSQCAPGYVGPVCGSCDEGYARKSLYDCRKCAEKGSNIAFFVIMMVLFTMFLVFTVLSAFKRRRQTANAAKIIIAFVQQLAILSTFKTQWPEATMGLITASEGATSAEVNSLTCVVDTTETPAFFINALVMIYILPATLMFIVPLVIKLIRMSGDFGRKITVSITFDNFLCMCTVIGFFMYPFIVSETFVLFACIGVDEDGNFADNPYAEFSLKGGSYLLVDTSYKCYDIGENDWHRKAAYMLGVPSLVALVFGLPIFVASFFIVNRHRLLEIKFVERWGFLYVGLKPKKWYWFFVTLWRTSFLGIIGMMIYEEIYQILVAMLWVLMYILITLTIEPYKIKGIVYMETVSSAAIWFILYLQMWISRANQIAAEEGRGEASKATKAVISTMIIATVIVTLIILFSIMAKAHVAEHTKSRYENITLRDIWIYVKGMFHKNVTKAKKFKSYVTTKTKSELRESSLAPQEDNGSYGSYSDEITNSKMQTATEVTSSGVNQAYKSSAPQSAMMLYLQAAKNGQIEDGDISKDFFDNVEAFQSKEKEKDFSVSMKLAGVLKKNSSKTAPEPEGEPEMIRVDSIPVATPAEDQDVINMTPIDESDVSMDLKMI